MAERDGQLVASTTGYRVPERPATLFIWQVAVCESARGQGLGRRMLEHLLASRACSGVTHLETSVTETNRASWSMFEGFAERAGAPLRREVLFDRRVHFDGQHESEILTRIGPFPHRGRQPAAQRVEAVDKENAHENI